MTEPIDHHPARRAAQIEAARAVLRAPGDDTEVRRACEVLLALSRDPLDRMLAERLLKDRTGRRNAPFSGDPS